MRKQLLLLKSLLVAALLGAGTSAWGELTKKTLYSQNFNSEESVPTEWTQSSGTLSLATDGANKFLREAYSGTGSRPAWYTGSAIRDAIGTYTTYTLEFDCCIKEGTYTNNYTQGVYVLGTTLGNSWGNPTAPLIGVRKSNNESTYTIYANSAATEETVDLTTGTWYHYVCAYDESTKEITFSILSQDQTSTIYTAKAFDYDYTGANGKFKSIMFVAGRGGTTPGQGTTELDNIVLSTMVDEEVVGDPTIGAPVYAGANRTVTITGGTSSKSNTVTTYYTIDGTDPSALNNEGSFTTSTKDVTITSNCTVKAITISSTAVESNIVNKAVTVGKLTLNAPTITMTALTENTGVYNPTYSFASDQSDILGTPTATITYSLNSGAATAGTSYTATTAGTLTVTASAEGYTSAQSEVTVKAGFILTNEIDVADIYGGYSNYSNEWPSGLDYEMIPDVTFSPINNTQGCTYRTTHGSTVFNTLYARNKAYTATCANMTENKIVVFADNNSNAYKPATNVSNTVSISKDGDIKYYKLYVQPTLTQSITVSAAEWKTLVSPYSLNFSSIEGLKAYIVTGGANGVLTKKQVTKVPAGTAVLLNGSATTYNVPVIAKSAATDDVSGNKLVGVVTNKEIAAETGYVLMNDENHLAFYKNQNAFTVGANTAYLPANFTGSGARSFFSLFNAETTGIEDAVKSKEIKDKIFYNLSGQRVKKATKGLYIVNGKKYVK